MKRRLKIPEHEKPKKPKYVPPKKPFKLPKSNHALPFAAAAALVFLSMPGDSKANTVIPAGPKPHDAADTEKPSETQPPEIAMGVSASTRYETSEGATTFVITYEKDGRMKDVHIQLSEETGTPQRVMTGAERSVIVTDKAIVITLGYNAAFRNDIFLTIEGPQPLDSSIMFPLPEDCLNGNLSAYTMVWGGDGEERLYFANSSGKVRSTRINVRDDPYSIANVGITQGFTLAAAGDYAVGYSAGSNTITFFRGSGEEEMPSSSVQLHNPVSSAPAWREVGGGIEVRFGQERVLLMHADPLDPSKFTAVLVPQ